MSLLSHRRPLASARRLGHGSAGQHSLNDESPALRSQAGGQETPRAVVHPAAQRQKQAWMCRHAVQWHQKCPEKHSQALLRVIYFKCVPDVGHLTGCCIFRLVIANGILRLVQARRKKNMSIGRCNYIRTK